MNAAAVFDLDGTLIRGTSAERLLVPYLARRGLVGWRQIGAALALATTLPLVGRTRALRRNKRYLAGVEVAAVRACFGEFLLDVLEKRWCSQLVARMASSREAGFEVHLVTGAPDFIAQAVAARFNMDSAVGTPMEVRADRFTGRLAGTHAFAEAKRGAVWALAGQRDLDLTHSYGFADHRSDVAFLECFGRPVAVAPDAALRREARRRGWEVMECG